MMGAPVLAGSCDTKTATTVVREPKGWKARVSNAFGTLPGSAGTCGTTASDACDASHGGYCYVPVSFRYPAVPAMLERNTDAVREYATADRWHLLADAHYILMRDSARAQARAGVSIPTYRWNWSGEVLNAWHARAIADASNAAHDAFGMRSWTYTRNLPVVPILLKARGLRVLLSADDDNLRAVESFAALYAGRVQVAYATPDGARPDWSTRTGRVLVCPATREGGRTVVPSCKSSTGFSGACAACRACIDTTATPDIAFRIH